MTENDNLVNSTSAASTAASERPSAQHPDLNQAPHHRARPLRNALRESFTSLWPVITLAWPALLALHIFQAAISQYFAFAADYIRASGREEIALIASSAALELLINLLWSSLWVLVVASTGAAVMGRQKRHSTWHLIREYFNPLLIENVRTIAAMLWRLPLFILPAMLEFVRLSLVPFVVIFDSHYSAGEVDALQASRKLLRSVKNLGALTLTLLLSSLLPWLIETLCQGDGGPWIWKNPMGVALEIALNFFVQIFATLFLFALYRQFVMMSSAPTPLPEEFVHADV